MHKTFVKALVVLSIGLFTTQSSFAAPLAIDLAANDYFNGTNRIGVFNWFGNKVMGNGFPNLALGAGFWGYGAWKNKSYEKYAGIAQVETVLATGLTVTIIKELAGRKRPDGSDDLSFPSAHAAYAFSTASVLGAFYGPRVGIPVYFLAALTAVARMQENRHWLTDTLGGAAVGIGFGLLFSSINKRQYNIKQAEKEAAAAMSAHQSSSFQASPMIGPGTVGANFSISF